MSCSYNTLAGSGTRQSSTTESSSSSSSSESEDEDEVGQPEECGSGRVRIRPEGPQRNSQERVRDQTGKRAGKIVDEDNGHEANSDESNKHAKGSTSRKRRRQDGLLKRLSDALLAAVRTLASSGLLAHVYDNINIVFKVAEQILGRKDSQENGTCATVFPLFKASKEDLKTSDLLESIDHAPPLQLDDILLSSEENKLLQACLRHTVLRIIILFSGGRLDHFKIDMECTMPTTEKKIENHKTEVFPLPAMHIDESSTIGNATVVDEVFTTVNYDQLSPEFFELLRILFGDQLSVARLRSVTNTRVGHDMPCNALLNTVHAPGLFHYQIALTGATMENHWGDPQSYTRNPGSLCFHNTVLDRKPIVMSSPPPYRTCRDLIFVSLYARVFRCLELVAGGQDLDTLAKDITFEQLEGYCCEIVDRFANPALVSELREERNEQLLSPSLTSTSPTATDAGDMVFENALLFMRDALLLREFTDSIKIADSGRIVNMLKVMTLAYRGGGRPKYAHECLHQIHNLTHVWPEKLR